jgi:hypothetical protein
VPASQTTTTRFSLSPLSYLSALQQVNATVDHADKLANQRKNIDKVISIQSQLIGDVRVPVPQINYYLSINIIYYLFIIFQKKNISVQYVAGPAPSPIRLRGRRLLAGGKGAEGEATVPVQ